jgi:hypothetical protein
MNRVSMQNYHCRCYVSHFNHWRAVSCYTHLVDLRREEVEHLNTYDTEMFSPFRN